MPLQTERYARPPIGPRRSLSIADLILRRGDIAAQGAQRSGDIWGNAVNQLGQIASGAVQAHGQRKGQEEQSAAIMAAFQGWDQKDPQMLYQSLVPIIGSEPAMTMTTGYVSLGRLGQQADQPDPEDFKLAISGAATAIETMGEEAFAQSWPEVMKGLGPGAGKFFGVALEEQYRPEYGQQIQALSKSWKASPKMTPVTTTGPGGEPVRQTFTPGQMAEGVPEHVKPAAPMKAPKSLAEIENEAAARARGTARGRPEEDEGAGLDWSLTGEDFLATVKPELQATVQQLGEYRRRPSATLYRSERGLRLLAMVSQYNPEYDEKLYGEGQKAIGEYTSGATHRNIIAINTLSNHLVPFAEAASALNNNDIQALNEWKNYFLKEFGSAVPTNFGALHTLVSDEIANTFKTSGSTDSAIRNAAETVYAAQSPAQLLGALKSLGRLAEGRITAIGNKYDVTFGAGAFDKKGYISEESQNAYQAIQEAEEIGDIGQAGTTDLGMVVDALEKLSLSPEEVEAVFRD